MKVNTTRVLIVFLGISVDFGRGTPGRKLHRCCSSEGFVCVFFKLKCNFKVINKCRFNRLWCPYNARDRMNDLW